MLSMFIKVWKLSPAAVNSRDISALASTKSTAVLGTHCSLSASAIGLLTSKSNQLTERLFHASLASSQHSATLLSSNTLTLGRDCQFDCPVKLHRESKKETLYSCPYLC